MAVGTNNFALLDLIEAVEIIKTRSGLTPIASAATLSRAIDRN
jgi:hypothetical protein